MNLATRQARVVTSACGHVSPTDLTRAVEAAGFPARTLWDTFREGSRVVLDVQGLKVPLWQLIWCSRGVVEKGQMMIVSTQQ